MVLQKFSLVLLHHLLGDQLLALGLALVDDDLVVLPQLDLVVLEGVGQVFVLVLGVRETAVRLSSSGAAGGS